SVSETGILVYGHGDETNRLVWMNREGKLSPIAAPPGSYRMPRLAPDGHKAVVSHVEPRSENADIWLIDLLRGVPTRFTFDPASDVFPIWSPEGNQIVFGSTRGKGPNLYLKETNHGSNEEPMLTTE